MEDCYLATKVRNFEKYKKYYVELVADGEQHESFKALCQVGMKNDEETRAKVKPILEKILDPVMAGLYLECLVANSPEPLAEYVRTNPLKTGFATSMIMVSIKMSLVLLEMAYRKFDDFNSTNTDDMLEDNPELLIRYTEIRDEIMQSERQLEYMHDTLECVIATNGFCTIL